MNKKLSGIERELVLQYLIDGNVPVTLTPIEENSQSQNIHNLNSQIFFPVAIKGENIKVNKSGMILLENPPESVCAFANKIVKVEFYFNRVGLFFQSKVKQTKKGLSLSLPNEIDRISEVFEEKQYDFNALVYFDFKNHKEINEKCIPLDENILFTRPVWKIIALEYQKKAKELLEQFVENAKKERNVGNGLQLIVICKYLIESRNEVSDMEGRIQNPKVLFVDHERIVLGMESKNCNYFQNQEYGLKLSFSIKSGPILCRDIFVTANVNKIYNHQNEFGEFSCVDFKYTTIQEEDLRFLFEKATKTLFV